jgi:hypothetical protein
LGLEPVRPKLAVSKVGFSVLKRPRQPSLSIVSSALVSDLRHLKVAHAKIKPALNLW